MDLSLNKLPWYAQVGLFVAIAIGGVSAFYFLYAAPSADAIAEQHRRLDLLRLDITKGMSIARKLPQFRSQVAELQTRLDGLRAVLPEEKDFGDLLRSLEMLATQSNLAIRTFKPAPVTTKQLHAEWPINIELEGNYHNLGLFFDRISKFSRIINIGTISVKASTRTEPNVTIAVSCVATTFVLLEAAKVAGLPLPAGAVVPGAGGTPGNPAIKLTPATFPTGPKQPGGAR
jgi:type IV pilus assembly protein PilO